MVAPSTRERAQTGVHPTVAHAVERRLLEERTRWAMQVHDGLTQAVTSAILELQTMRHRIESDPRAAIAALKEVEDQIREDLHLIRRLLFDMMAEEPDSEPAFAGLVRSLADRWQLPTRVEVEGELGGMPDVVLEALHAIVAESLANAAKHSGATEASVRVHAGEGELVLDVDRPWPRHLRGPRRRPAFRTSHHAGPRRIRRRVLDRGIDPRARHHGARRAPRRRAR